MLSFLIFSPALAAVLVALLPSEEQRLQRAVGLAGMLLALATAGLVWASFDSHSLAPEYQLQQQLAWAPTLGFSYHVGVDGFGLVLLELTALLSPLALWSATRPAQSRVKEFVIALLLLESAMLGTLAALDLVLFYFFWEAMLLPLYLLIGIWGSQRRGGAALKYFLYTISGSLLMLVAILALHVASGPPDHRTFDLPTLLSQLPHLSAGAQRWLFLGFAAAFALKVPMVPLHTWLPDAQAEGPVASAILLGVKVGTFGFLRFAFPLFPDAAVHYGPWLAGLAVCGMLYGALVALNQSDLGRLVSFSSISHSGFVMLGLCAFTAGGITGGVYQMLSSGIATAALFLLVGVLYDRQQTREISRFGGLAAAVPSVAAIFLFISLSTMGVPGTNGFIGEFLILTGTFTSKLANSPWYGAAGALGVVLGAVYMLSAVQRVFFGPLKANPSPRAEATPFDARLGSTDDSVRGGLAVSTVRAWAKGDLASSAPSTSASSKFSGMADLSKTEWALLLPLVALVAVMGIFPAPFLAPIVPAAERLVARLERGHPRQAGEPPPSLAMARRGPPQPANPYDRSTANRPPGPPGPSSQRPGGIGRNPAAGFPDRPPAPPGNHGMPDRPRTGETPANQLRPAPVAH